jgi:nitroreductase
LEVFMNAFTVILERRSIRSYTSETVSDENVEQLLRAAMSAPSAGNQQPWHFVVIRERNLLDAIPSFHPYSQMLRQAQAAILVCGEPAVAKHEGYWVQDCAAATENILIAAAALGLGAVWLGVHPREERVAGFRKLLGVPPHIIPFALVPVGHPAERKPPSDRYDTARIHADLW